MAITWTNFYPGNQQLKDERTLSLIGILCATGGAHGREFDERRHRRRFPNRDPIYRILRRKANNGRWLRIRVGENADENKVVIVYHRLKHFPANLNRWGVSIGIDPDVFVTEAPVLNLAGIINEQLLADARRNLPLRDGTARVADLVIYDHIYNESASGIAPDNVRRGSLIGELGLVAQTTPAIMNSWVQRDDADPLRVLGRPVRVPRPRDENNQRIEGWARDNDDGTPLDADCIRTILRPF